MMRPIEAASSAGSFTFRIAYEPPAMAPTTTTTGAAGFRSNTSTAATITAAAKSRATIAPSDEVRRAPPGLRLVGLLVLQVVLHAAIVRAKAASGKDSTTTIHRALALLDRAIVRVLPAVPRPVVRRLSDRYIAGPELDDAVAVVRKLNGAGKLATLDVLGEEVASREEALAIRGEYEEAMAAIEREGLDANVSVKLTGLGLVVDPALCAESVRALVRAAAENGRFVRIDMEDSSTTTATLDLYRELRAEGHDNVGIVLQAMLRRTLDDVLELVSLAAQRPRLQGDLRRAGRPRLPG